MTDSSKTPNLGRFIWRETMTKDRAKAKTFYGGLFGWKFHDMDMGPQGTYTILQNGGGGAEDRGVGGMMQLGPEHGAAPSHWVSYAFVDDVDAAIARAKELGGKAHWGPFDVANVGRMAGIESFDGAILAIMKPFPPDEPRKNERPAVGAFCWETLTTSDVERSKTFWSKVIGWKPSTGAGQPTFAVGDGMENQVADVQLAQNGVPPHWLTFVVVEKLEPSCEKVGKLGGKVVVPPMPVPEIGRIAVITDDQGAALGLFEPNR